MKLIKDLGMCHINPNSGKYIKKATRFGLYRCPECKKVFITLTKNVKNGRTAHCRKCGYKLKTSKYLKKGTSSTTDPLYTRWLNMRFRCNSPKCSNYKRYGERGIRVCSEWDTDFLVFKEWAENNGFKPNLTLDRKDNDGDYCPENCRFTTRHVQAHNQRTIRSTNSTGFKGVYYSKSHKKFCAKLMFKNKGHHIGLYTTALQAAIAHDTYVQNLGLPNTTNGLI